MGTIVISHVAGTQPARVEINRPNGRRALAVEMPSTYRFRATDRPEDNLRSQSRWYLEEFLEYPSPPRTQQAARVEETLREWGTQAFNALFQSGKARDWFIEARRENESDGRPLDLRVSRDAPAILSWLWEALNDPETGVLAHRACMERRLKYQLPALPLLSEKLPKDRIRIPLVTARPYEGEIQYRSISGALIELIQTEKPSAAVGLLRPRTFDQSRELHRKPHRYDILHFNGNGADMPDAAPGNHGEMFKPHGPEGRLVFKDEDGKEHPVENGLRLRLKEKSASRTRLKQLLSRLAAFVEEKEEGKW